MAFVFELAVKTPIYLDNHATTRVDPRVLTAMLPYFSEVYGNAASTSHAFGWEARDAVEEARESIGRLIGASAREIVFTSGATESNNLALRGVAERGRRKGNHLISVATEHRSVLDPLERLGRRGYEISLLNVTQSPSGIAGVVTAEAVADAIREETILVSVMLANNEIGVLQPIARIAKVCRARGVLLHCDATQAVGKLPVDVARLGVDLMSFTAHKMYGPKGVGALYVRRSAPFVRLDCQVSGGGHEGGLRSGTLNVPGIVGFAKALELCEAEQVAETERLFALRNRLFAGLSAGVEELSLNGPEMDNLELRLAGNLNVSFGGVDGEALLLNVREIAVSSGSACTSANPEPSHVLRAIGLSEDATRSSLRFGLGRFNTEEEIDFAIAVTCQAVSKLRALSSF
jgi:cysteine desulfurase